MSIDIEADTDMATPMVSKPKLALYWASSCGGCEIAVLDI